MILAILALLASPALQDAHLQEVDGGTLVLHHAVRSVPLAELDVERKPELDALLQGTGSRPGWLEPSRIAWPWAKLDGPGDTIVDVPGYDPSAWQPPVFGEARLVVRTSEPRDVHGVLFVPREGGAERFPFVLRAAEGPVGEQEFLRARIRRDARLVRRRVPGAAWYRHRIEEDRRALGDTVVEDPVLPLWTRPSEDEGELVLAYDLFSGGRAVSENLQLDRVIPVGEDDGGTSVDVDSLEGITVREFDWGARLPSGEPAIDPLAAVVPADQHAVFFRSFASFVRVLDELAALGEAPLALFEERSSDAGTRGRTERQLALELDAVARALGGLAVRSVALTGSDPYLRTGSDLALLFACDDPDALRAFVRVRQMEAQMAVPETATLGGRLADGTHWEGVASPSRAVSSYLAELRRPPGSGAVVAVANSLVQLERVARTASGESDALGASPELRFFRSRYPLGAADEDALVVLPDAAIRRWCGPRWRIGAARRTRAAALLVDRAVADVDRVMLGAASEGSADPRFAELGEVSFGPDGVRSSVYGTPSFLTPIAELDLDRVSQREADLYGRWREGYQANWSNFFDPIALSLAVGDEGVRADLTVMPLILGTDYADLHELVGNAALSPDAADPHEEARVQLAVAVDPAGPMITDVGESMSGLIAQLGADPMAWLGRWMTVFVDADPLLEDLLESSGMDEAFEDVRVDPNELPLVLEFGVVSPVRLAGFLATLRAFVEGSAPGMLSWEPDSEGERRFVHVGSAVPGVEDVSIWYATTPTALVVSLRRDALLRAMEREELRRSGAGAPSKGWPGESAALVLEREGLRLVEHLLDEPVNDTLAEACWANLPILDEWKARFPDLDPVDVHERVFGVRLTCPAGGVYAWNEADGTMESSVLGHRGAPRGRAELPAAWTRFEAARLGLTFEPDGLRARAELER